MRPPVFFLIAGEASGDLLGARLMRALRAKVGDSIRFVGIGGPMMQAEGLELLFPHTELMHFGVFEVLRHIPRLLGRIRQAAQAVIDTNPLALITIDSPDFSFRVAKRVRKKAQDKIRLIHYVAPTVWAWRPGRAKKIARFLDHLLAVLPFEPPYFTREGLACTFVGHSVVEGDAGKGDGKAFREARGLADDVPLLTVLPGSRVSELDRLLPVFRRTVALLREKFPNLNIVVPTVPHLKERVRADVATWGVPAHIVEGEKDKFAAFAASTAALACSGTVALELALAHLPSVIAYKISPVSCFLFRPFMLVRYVNLVNIMHDAPVVPEFLQNDCTPEKLAQGVGTLLGTSKARREQISKLKQTAEWLGAGQFVPSEKAAATVLDVVRPPAVLQVLPALVTGGVERGTVETVSALVANDFRAFVASSGGPMVREVEAAGGMHITLPLASKNPVTMVLNIGRLAKVMRQHQIDIVHVRSRAPAWSAYFAARRTGAHFVTTFHNAYGAGSALKRFYNSAMAKGERVIAISNFVAAYASQTYGVARAILRVVPRGVDEAAFDPEAVGDARVFALRKAWGIPDGVRVVLLPGRFSRWKGQKVFVEALARLTAKDCVGVIVGGGLGSAYGREVADAIANAGLGEKVFCFDTCRDMPAAYKLADVVVVPSTRPEGFGRVVVEAQAMGTPVVASDHGGAAETIVDGKTGWLTPPGDADALALCLGRVLALSAPKRQDFALRARAHIRDHFTTALMTAKTLEIYRELFQKPKLY